MRQLLSLYVCFILQSKHAFGVLEITCSSGMADRPRELGDFKGVGRFEAKF